jgi:hypothetical protein
VVFKGKKFNDIANFLYFYDYLPFEEDLALYLNNSKFPLPNLIKIRSSIRSSFFIVATPRVATIKKNEERIEDLILIRLPFTQG